LTTMNLMLHDLFELGTVLGVVGLVLWFLMGGE
jgi:hypothetical protein